MKALSTYKTKAAIFADLKKEKLKVSYTYGTNWSISRGTSRWYWVDVAIRFSTRQNQFSCAYDALGDFWLNATLSKYWPYLLKAMLLAKKPKYLQCSTPDTEKYQPLIKALQKVGFLPVTAVKTRHAGEHYNVLIWEYLG